MNPQKNQLKSVHFKNATIYLWTVKSFGLLGWKVWPAATDWLGESGCTEKWNPLLIWVILIGFAGTEI